MNRVLILYFLALSLSVSAQSTANAFSVAPNPFIQRTLLSYTIVAADTVHIQVLSIVGKVVLTPVNKKWTAAGVYQDSLRMDSLPGGIYFVTMQVGNQKALVTKIVKSTPEDISETPISLQYKLHYNLNGEILIAFPSLREHCRIQVLNMAGQEVFHSTINPDTNQLTLRQPAGMYVVLLSNSQVQGRFKAFFL